jgi:two-component system sensor histidine kinase YesM
MRQAVYSLQQKLARIMLPVFILFTLINGILLYAFLSIGVQRSAVLNYHNQASLLQLLILREMQSIEQISMGIMFNSAIQNLLMDESLLKTSRDQNIISSILINYRNFRDTGNIILFSLDGRMLTSTEGYDNNRSLKDIDYFSLVESSQGAPVWIANHTDPGDFLYRNESVITLVQKIRRLDILHPEYSGIALGYVVFNIGQNFFSSLIKDVAWHEKGSLSLVDDEENIIAIGSSKSTGIAPYLPGSLPFKAETWFDKRQDLLVTVQPLGRYPWYVEGIVRISSIMEGVNTVIVMGIAVSVVFAFVFATMVFRWTRTISYPLRKLEEEMSRINLSQTEAIVLEQSSVKEIRSIIYSYEAMVKRLSQLTEEVYQSRLQSKEYELAGIRAEFQALQSQINPHFLYNTLDSINWMADMEGNVQIVEMVTHLADFLRFSAKTAVMATIAEELTNVDNYVYIQKIRYGERFNYYKDCDPGLLSYPIIKLTMQPLVENSIIHGVENQQQSTDIKTRIYRDKNRICISVSDNGIGMNKATQEFLWQKILANQGIGLPNVYHRLKFSYPDSFKFTITSASGEGTIVFFSYPAEF